MDACTLSTTRSVRPPARCSSLARHTQAGMQDDRATAAKSIRRVEYAGNNQTTTHIQRENIRVMYEGGLCARGRLVFL